MTLVQGNGSGNAAQMVASGRAQLAYADAVAVMQLIAKGTPMRIVSTVYQSNPNAVMALKKTGITSVGKGIGEEGRGTFGIVADDDAAIAAQGQQPQGVRHQHDRHAGRVDGACASSGPGGRGAWIDRRVSDPGRVQGAQLDVWRFADHGVPTVSTSIFASNDFLKAGSGRREEIRRGKSQGLGLRARQSGKGGPRPQEGLSGDEREAGRGRLAAIKPLFCSGGAKFIGKAEEAHWAKSQELARRGQAASRRTRSEDVLHLRLPARRRRRCALASSVAPSRLEDHGKTTNDGLVTPMPTCMWAWRFEARAERSPMQTSCRSPGSRATSPSCIRVTSTPESSQFGRRVAHGMLGLAYAHGLMWARTGELRETAVAFLGIGEWKFVGPIFIGDTIFVNYRIVELRDSKSQADASHRDVRC